MKQLFITLSLIFVLSSTVLAQSGHWVTGIYTGWGQDTYPPSAVDYSAVTQIMHFAVWPNSNGSLDASTNGLDATSTAALIAGAHKVGTKVIFSVGGWATESNFNSAMSSTNRSTFVTNLVNFMNSRGYDGIDIDDEPLSSSDAANYEAFIPLLRAAMGTGKLLTCSTQWAPSIIAAVQSYFDQVNIMTYDLSGAWGGWVTWHNSALYNGGYKFPSGGALPCADDMVKEWEAAGIPAAKIGIGAEWGGARWSGGAGTSTGGAALPRQSWTTAPSVAQDVPYNSLYPQYYSDQNYRWDTVAQCSYLSIDNTGNANDNFISYDDENSMRAKIAYAKANIGGVIFFNLEDGYLPSSYPNRDRLLQAVKQAFFGTTSPPTSPTIPNAPILASPVNGATGVAINPTLSWNTSTGATSYRVQVSANSSFSTTIVDQSGVTSASQAVSGLANNTTYYWQVNATNTGGTSAWSTVSGFTTASDISSTDLWVYQEALLSPWFNASWNASTTYASTDVVYADAHSIRVVQHAWGGLSLHGGPWGAAIHADPTLYTSFQFAVYGGSTGESIAVIFENDAANRFPRISYGSIPANQWVVITLPMSRLNPKNYSVDRVDILEMSGTTKVYYVDNIRFVRAGAAAEAGSGATAENRTVSPSIDLAQNFPNPFNPTTGINYTLQQDAHVTLAVFNSIGQQVALLTNEDQAAGLHGVQFNASTLASGVYFYRLMAKPISGDNAGVFVEIRKMVYTK